MKSPEQAPSMEEILQTIRGVISGEAAKTESKEKSDILELTDMVMEDGSVVNVKEQEDEKRANEAQDVLNDIDDALADVLKKQSEEEEIRNSVVISEKVAETDQKEPVVEENHVSLEELMKDYNPTTEQEDHFPDDLEDTNVFVPKSLKEKKSIISDEAAQASSEALKSLLKKKHKTTPSGEEGSVSFRSGVTLEDLVVELLTPKLSEWLDNNLAALVTSMVEKEIKKIVPNDE